MKVELPEREKVDMNYIRIMYVVYIRNRCMRDDRGNDYRELVFSCGFGRQR